MDPYPAAIANDEPTSDVERLDDLDLDALRALLEEAGRLPAPGAA